MKAPLPGSPIGSRGSLGLTKATSQRYKSVELRVLLRVLRVLS